MFYAITLQKAHGVHCHLIIKQDTHSQPLLIQRSTFATEIHLQKGTVKSDLFHSAKTAKGKPIHTNIQTCTHIQIAWVPANHTSSRQFPIVFSVLRRKVAVYSVYVNNQMWVVIEKLLSTQIIFPRDNCASFVTYSENHCLFGTSLFKAKEREWR